MVEDSAPVYGTREALLKRELLIIGAGVLLVLAAVYISWMLIFRLNAPDAVVRTFIEADIAGRYPDQQALIARTWDAKLITDMAQEFRRQRGVSLFRDYQIVTTSINGNDAQVNVTVTAIPPAASLFPGGTQTPHSLIVPFHLIRDNNEWKIDPTRTLVSLSGVLVASGFQQLVPRLRNAVPPVFGVPPAPSASPGGRP